MEMNIERDVQRPVVRVNRKPRSWKWIIPAALVLLLTGAAGGAACTSYFDLIGSAETQVVLGEAYEEKGGEAGVFGVSLNDWIKTEGTVDTSKPGDYTITYSLNGIGWVKPLTRQVSVLDITIPELLLASGEAITLPVGEAYIEPGWTASDNYDGDLTSKVRVEGEVDTSKAGEYVLTYLVADSSGNEARAQRTVSVLPQSPLTMGLKEFTLNAYFQDVILPETEDAGEDYINGTIFIGDSITENGLGWGFFPYRNVWAMHGIQPDTIQTEPIKVYGGKNGDEEMLAVNAAAEYKPGRVLINIGSNSVYKMAPDVFAAEYQKFLAAFKAQSPDTDIIICSVLPVDKRYDESERTAYTTNNDKCNKINYALAQLCREQGYKFVNLAEALKDENGQARQGLVYETDGIHPNKSTYPLMMEYIRTHAWIKETSK